MKAEGDDYVYELLANQPVATEDFFRCRVAAAVQPGTDSLRMYLQADNQLFRSDNDGAGWTEMPELDSYVGQCWLINFLTLHLKQNRHPKPIWLAN